MNIESILNFWPVGVVVILILLLALGIKVLSKPKKCISCNLGTYDSFVDSDDKRIPMCREHLLKRFKEEFLNSNFKMVVIEPDFEKFSMAYVYAIPDRLLQWEYPQAVFDKITNIISSISGKDCEGCRSVANVAFLKKEDYKFPFLENITAIPKYLCKNCALGKIEPLIRNSRTPFYEGIYAPTTGDGLYHIQEF